MSHSQLYRDVLDSPRWQALRERLIAERDNACASCAVVKPARDLQLHHKTYDRLGRELASDLEVLCKMCHEEADRRRASRTYGRRVTGWAEAKYGEGATDSWTPNDWDTAEEEFEAWLDD